MRGADAPRKVLTVSRKIERLVNLTIALLATKRFLTKSEIFRSIDGYEGSVESKERMFERDKDDLRNLGIDIEVGGLDPLFEDEAGYRIRPESYQLQLGEISGVQLALLSLAAEAWRGAAMDVLAQSALLKLQSIGIESDLDCLPAISPRISSVEIDFSIILQAISGRKTITFDYLSDAMLVKKRTLNPYGIATRGGHWYLIGFDLDRTQVRTFRLDRLHGAIELSKKAIDYEIPTQFDIEESLGQTEAQDLATVDVRKGKAQILRQMAIEISDNNEWDRLIIPFSDLSTMVDLILWHGDDVLLIEPRSLKLAIMKALKTIVKLHA